MKKTVLSAGLTLCLLCAIVSQNLFAQPTELANVTKQGFKGLKPMDNNGYYIQCIDGSKGMGKKAKTQLHLYILSNDLKVTADFVMELIGEEKIEDVAYNGDNFMIIVSSYQARTRTFRVVNKSGQEVAVNKQEKVNPRLLTKPAIIIPVGAADFIVLNYVKEKKVGYSVERYNSKLEQAYSQTQIPEKKKLFPVDFKLVNDHLYILEFLDSDNDYFEYHIASYDIANGNQLSKKYLTSGDNKAYGFATFLKEGADGSVLTGGMYFDDPRIQKRNSDGFFAARMDKDGNLKFTYVDWATVEKTIKEGNSTIGIWGGKTKTFMHDLAVNADGSFTLIGENYRRGDADLAGNKSKGIGIAMKVAGGSDDEGEEAVTAAEFVLMDFDSKGNFVTCRKVDKPNAVTIVRNTEDPNDPPYIGQRKGLNLANILNNNGYMPYRFVVNNGSKSYIAFWQRYDPMIKELLYFTPLSATKMDTTSVEVTGAELKVQQDFQNKAMGKLGGLGKLAKKTGELTGASYENYFYLRGSHDPFDYRAKSLNTRVIPANIPGKVVIYDFVPDPPDPNEKKSFWSMIQTVNGTLKVWHIDVPTI